MKHYEISDVGQPNLFREFFPYASVPRIAFDHGELPAHPARHAYITDSTLRDGQQAGPPFSVPQVSRIFDFLHELSGPNGFIRQTEFFLYTEKDRAALDACRAKNYRFPEITGWIRASRKDLQLVCDMGIKETGILTSASDYHIFLKLKSTRRDILGRYLEVVSAALEKGITPRCSFEDITRADIYGFCVPFAIELMRLREKSGIDIKVRLCDTLGLAVPYPGAALPRSVPALVKAFIDDAGVPSRLLEWHGHNDFHKALINAATAWLHGCSGAGGTLLGIGERTGNPPVEALMVEYSALKGLPGLIDRKVMVEVIRYFQSQLGREVTPSSRRWL